MKYVVGLPYRVKSFRDNLMATCKLENVFEIDNTENNIGFAASHNLGIQKMYDDGAEWYIVMSAAVRFGEPGGLDFIEILKNTESVIIEALGVYGWHFIAFHKTLIDKVGFWDTNFTPYGYEDLDYSMRIQRAFLLEYDDHWEKIVKNKTLWDKVKIEIKDKCARILKQTNQKACILKGGEEAFPARVGRKREGALEKLEFFAYFLGQCQKV